MAPTRFFHKIDGNVHELPDRGPFRYERELQGFFEKHLHTLTGVEFLASEHPTGPRHRRRIDTLGIDGAGRPVVVEYTRRQNQNVINQGLDYLAWLEDHQAEFRELARRQLGDGRVTDIDSERRACCASPRNTRVRTRSLRKTAAGILNCFATDGTAMHMWRWSRCTVARHPSRCRRRTSYQHPATALWTKARTTPSTNLGTRPARNPDSVPRAREVGEIAGQCANRPFQERDLIQVHGRPRRQAAGSCLRPHECPERPPRTHPREAPELFPSRGRLHPPLRS